MKSKTQHTMKATIPTIDAIPTYIKVADNKNVIHLSDIPPTITRN